MIDFPRCYLCFPREEWSMVTWRWPVFEEAEIGAMSRWAGREASQRWSKVFEGGDLLENLDEIDLAVAVFDKTCQLNSYIREWESPEGGYYLPIQTAEWLEVVDKLIDASYQMAFNKINRLYPNDPAAARFLSDETRTLAVDFARSAMTHQWDECLDSEGDGPIEREVDTKVFIDRYLPDPDTLPPRRFRVVTLGGLQTSNPQYIWLDAYMREVDPPPTTEEPSSSAEN